MKIKKTQYVVETYYTNGNVFLRGPFKVKTVAENYVRELYDKAKWGSLGIHDVRAVSPS